MVVAAAAAAAIQEVEVEEESREEEGRRAAARELFEIYHTCLLSRRMELSIDECDPSYITNVLLQKLKKELDGTCITEGYVKPNSVEDVVYTSGVLKKGMIEVDVRFKCDICLPVEGAVYVANFISMTKAGIHALINDSEGNAPVRIFLNRELHLDNEHFAKYEDSDFQKANRCFKVKLLFWKRELNDKSISAIGELVL